MWKNATFVIVHLSLLLVQVDVLAAASGNVATCFFSFLNDERVKVKLLLCVGTAQHCLSISIVGIVYLLHIRIINTTLHIYS
jgi:hypothetical protein